MLRVIIKFDILDDFTYLKCVYKSYRLVPKLRPVA